MSVDDVFVRAGDLAAGGNILLAAGAGPDGRADARVTILSGISTRETFSQRKSSGFGLFTCGGRLDFYRARLDRSQTGSVENVASTLVAGGDIDVLAPGDVVVGGSVLAALCLATLVAGRDLALLPGGEAQSRSHYSRRSGFGFGVSAGGGAGVVLEAGRDARLVAASISSPADVDILAGRDLSILPGASAQSRTRVQTQSFAGIIATVGTNVVGAARRLASSLDTFGSGYGNSTYRAIGMASGVMQAADAVRDLSNPQLTASVSVGYSQSRSSLIEQATGVVPATLDAGRDLTLVAVQARAGRDLALIAGRDNAVTAAQGTAPPRRWRC